MSKPKLLEKWLETAQLTPTELAQRCGLDLKVVSSICAGGYTSSPQQRRKIADALGLNVDDIAWLKAMEPTPMYGHGPQFGRSP